MGGNADKHLPPIASDHCIASPKIFPGGFSTHSVFPFPAFSHQPKHLLVPKTRSILFLLGKSQKWRVLVRRGRFLVRQAVFGCLMGMSPTTLT